MDAATPTPCGTNLIYYFTESKSLFNRTKAFYKLSSSLAKYNYDPATASSKSIASIFKPIEAYNTGWVRYSPFTLISFIGWGVNIAFTFVIIGPLKPYNTILSSLRRIPSTRIQSIVDPCPSNTLRSKTVQLNVSFTYIFFFKNIDVYFTITDNRSGIPSPVTPDVGITET